MSFTYDLTTKIGQVRLLVPDNEASAYDLQDDEITYFLGLVGQNVMAAAARACDHLARKYAKLPTFSADGLQISNGQRAQTFAARAAELRASISDSMSSITLIKTDGYSSTDNDYS